MLRCVAVISALLIIPCASENPCVDKLSVDISEGNRFGDGSIVHEGISFPPKYVYTKNDTGEIKTYGCVCKLKKCFRKCCPLGTVMYDRKCTAMLDKDNITNHGLNIFHKHNFQKKKSIEEAGFFMLFGFPGDKVYLEDAQWYIQEDGNLYVELPNQIPNQFIYNPSQYCIDSLVSSDDPSDTQLIALIRVASEAKENYYQLNSPCMLVSCFFILLTVAVYAWIPELQNLHGLVLIAYLVSFFFGLLFMATMQILIVNGNIGQLACNNLTFIIYFSLLSAFFWMNVMCYDIWWTFSGKRAASGRRPSRSRFFAYSVYAFGVPLALTVLVIALEYSNLPDHWMLPRLSLQGCFFYGNSKLIYLYGPIVILCVANMCFFTLTAVKIANIRKQTAAVLEKDKSSSTHVKDNESTQRFGLYIKLFAVMGVSWILEVVSYIVPTARIVWNITDVYNVLVGLNVFIIFVCKKKTLRSIKKRYYIARGIPMPKTQTLSSTYTNRHSSVQSKTDFQMTVNK